MDDLKPCPFCGGEAEEIEPPRKGYWMGFWRIRCTGCHALMHGSHRGMNRDAWNRRAERTCRMVDCGTHDTCIVNRELSNGDVMSMKFGYRQCSECGAFVFDCPTVHYCPNCGARVIEEES